MKSIFLSALLLFSSLSFAGPRTGNGGDPHVAQFLNAATAACKWFASKPAYESFADPCNRELNDLEASVNMTTRKARLIAVNQNLRDKNGVDKDAVTDPDTRVISISIPRWDAEKDRDHILTAIMEMSLLINLPNRYAVASDYLISVAANSQAVLDAASPCGSMQETLAQLTSTYIDVFKACYSLEQSGQTKSQNYQQEVIFAKELEKTAAHDNLVATQICGDDAVTTMELSGACKMRDQK